ncbi:hypothetical protein N0V90_010725 [Kalmusia sp. IMI 367209]|nr:hypothetical protein N0V90_010725 [Kalmusia sp. IMI 367209]
MESFHEISTPRVVHPSQDPQDVIPSYAEATTTLQAIPQSPPPPSDEPPAYALVDASQTSFSIHGTFIHTSTGPAYQLSSPLDQRGPYFRIRRLRTKEAQQLSIRDAPPIAFDKSYILYEANDPPLLNKEYHLIGKRRACLPGVVEFKFHIGKWRAVHVPRSGGKRREILKCKKLGASGGARLSRSKDMDRCEWIDTEGKVVAMERFEGRKDGTVVPKIELAGHPDQTWRELMLALWATKLWVAFGLEKTAATGGKMRLASGNTAGGPIFSPVGLGFGSGSRNL